MSKELCLNIWIVVNQETGFVKSLGARMYCLEGTDEQKTAALKFMAGSDFALATKMQIPDNHVVHHGDEVIEGAVPPAELEDMSSPIYEELYSFMEKQKDNQLAFEGFDCFLGERIPDNPLYVVTPLVENEFGEIEMFE